MSGWKGKQQNNHVKHFHIYTQLIQLVYNKSMKNVTLLEMKRNPELRKKLEEETERIKRKEPALNDYEAEHEAYLMLEINEEVIAIRDRDEEKAPAQLNKLFDEYKAQMDYYEEVIAEIIYQDCWSDPEMIPKGQQEWLDDALLPQYKEGLSAEGYRDYERVYKDLRDKNFLPVIKSQPEPLWNQAATDCRDRLRKVSSFLSPKESWYRYQTERGLTCEEWKEREAKSRNISVAELQAILDEELHQKNQRDIRNRYGN